MANVDIQHEICIIARNKGNEVNDVFKELGATPLGFTLRREHTYLFIDLNTKRSTWAGKDFYLEGRRIVEAEDFINPQWRRENLSMYLI